MLKKVTNRIYSWGFQERLTIILILFALIPLLIIQQMMMHFYENHIIAEASNSTLSVVKANNNVLEMFMDGVETTSQLMIDSEFYYDIFSNFQDMSIGDCLRSDRVISAEMAKQFSAQDEIYEAYLYTSKWIFGKDTGLMTTSIEGAQNAGFISAANQSNGLPHWITGYDYGKSIGSSYLMQNGYYAWKYPLTMVRQMNFQYSSTGSYQKLSADAEKPVLVVHILENSVRELYAGSIGYEGSLYAVANSDGTIISSDNEKFPVGSRAQEEIFTHFGESGYLSCRLDQVPYLLCYDTISEKGLLSFAFVPMDVLMKNTVAKTRQLQFICVISLILLSVLVAFLLSRTITKPINALITASRRVAGGNFSADTPVPHGRDFKLLTESFNHMETQIDRLIHENYEISLREKETQLMALSMQINPHFLYNTLNTINMLAIQNNDEETSELIVDLSEMLQYTFKNTSEKCTLADEIAWVSNYLDIMSRRYDNVFVTRMDIEEELVDCRVPKFLLQPLVENSILHGFSQRQEGGVLTIRITRQEEDMIILVSDNGKGMDEAQLENYTDSLARDGHVGISNIHRRLSLLYGEHYKIQVKSEPEKGTRITIRIPCEFSV